MCTIIIILKVQTHEILWTKKTQNEHNGTLLLHLYQTLLQKVITHHSNVIASALKVVPGRNKIKISNRVIHRSPFFN